VAYPRFLKTLPVPVAGAAAGLAATAGAFFVPVAPTPFYMVPITERFAAAGPRDVDMDVAGRATDMAVAGRALDMTVAARFLTTVPALPSLDSLMPLTLRVVRVGGRAAGCTAVRLVLAVEAVVPWEELSVTVLARVRAFSTMLLSMLVAVDILVGDTGRAMLDLTGEV
jgi:hypothetical protein